jgi:hypothetical protein
MAYLVIVYADDIFPRTIIEYHDPFTRRIVYQYEVWHDYQHDDWYDG